ncbi:hypothetical protein GCM10007939_14780 [Amylibacter marinus]|uniref:Uncharacterized protein n=1 Tax=Amylibacter marinus TaxID=1475483 RepID=A0ABQ5VUS9_9RHOB|nr:hypothetical protein [Amylibacter marinus]GLQ35195.1 hypothetical protein GCM10007939_14780 [Amylibacter marinus]
MNIKGAGGSDGGVGGFFIGLTMMIAGGYLFLRAITVTTHFGLGRGLYSLGTFEITSGMVLIPFIFGVGMIFFNSKNWLGWGLAGASLIMLVFGVIASIDFRFARMSAFDLLMIIVLLVGGIGLFLRSLRAS